MDTGRIVSIAWSGLPPYAACCIEAYIQSGIGERLQVLSTRSRIPHRNVERILGQPVTWVEGADEMVSWKQLGLEIPDVFFITGWAIPSFNRLAREVRTNGGHVVLMSDNNWIGTPRQILGSMWFSIFKRRLYQYVLVPGISGGVFAKHLGFNSSQIYLGLYGADSSVFSKGPPLSGRQKRMLFVGQFVDRKGIPELIKALKSLRKHLIGWKVVLMGDGPLRDALSCEEAVEVLNFGSPVEVAAEMRRSRFFLLPSREEHWGVVVHEAALSGCGLILSDSVGSAPDFISNGSGFMHMAKDSESIARALLKAIQLEGESLDAFGEECHRNAINYGPRAFTEAVKTIVQD